LADLCRADLVCEGEDALEPVGEQRRGRLGHSGRIFRSLRAVILACLRVLDTISLLYHPIHALCGVFAGQPEIAGPLAKCADRHHRYPESSRAEPRIFSCSVVKRRLPTIQPQSLAAALRCKEQMSADSV